MSPDLLPLVMAAPLLAWMAVSDFVWMRIPNMLVLAMLGLFAVAAPLCLGFDAIVGRLAVGAIVLAAGFVAFLFGVLAGGDVKALAALQLFIPLGREPIALYGLTFSAAMLAGLILMLVLRRVAGGPQAAFLSLSVAQGYPMGISIALAGIAYPFVAGL
ncbi:prepilin peptidase [Vannielia litorea]|uniref:prepilin peptidase n=1 Tax=Vannielia litorea TaxID=1217970 RepID=UPI001BCDE346|nr:prepilin peptidase [Vannielia litorea]MBS8225606.1 peptidase [Vannielia litorea]